MKLRGLEVSPSFTENFEMNKIMFGVFSHVSDFRIGVRTLYDDTAPW